MPFVKNQKKILPSLGAIYNDKNNTPDANKVEEPSPGIGEVGAAAFRLRNSLVSTSLSLYENPSIPFRNTGDLDPDFNPLSHIDGYEMYADRFMFTNDIDEVNLIKSRITREKQDRETIEKGGWTGTLAEFLAGALDPISIVAGGIATGTVKAGASILTKGLVAGRAGLAGAASSELLLQASQETKDWGESALNISGGAFIGGVLGSAGGLYKAYKLKKGEAGFNTAARKLEQEMTIPGEDQIDFLGGQRIPLDISDVSLATQIGEGGSIGAAAVKQAEVKLKSALGLDKLPSSPSIRTITSPSMETRLASEGLADNGLFQLKNTKGIATPESAEAFSKSLIRQETTSVYQINQNAYSEYTQYLKSNPAMGKRLKYQDFKDQVGLAMKNNDIDPNPFVQKAARENRRIVNGIYQLAVEHELLPPNLVRKTAPSYFTRIWDRAAITQGRDQFQKILIKYFKISNPGIDSLDAQDFATQAIEKIMGNTHRVDFINVLKLANPRGPLKELTLEIPDSWVSDFVINDVEVVMKKYINTLVPDIAIKRRFPNDTVSLDGTIAKIKDDYSNMISKIRDTDPQAAKKRAKLNKSLKTDVRDVIAMRDIIRGTYQINPDNILNKNPALATGIKQYNSSTLLGKLALSTSIDTGGVAFTHGWMNTLRETFVPFVRNLPNILTRNKNNARSQGIEELKSLGYGQDVKAALNMILDSTTMTWEGISPELNATSNFFKKTLNAISKGAQLINFSAYINDQVRLMGSYVGMAQILRASTAKNISQKNLEKLARFGLDKSLLQKIGVQFKQHGRKENGRFAAGIDSWQDREAYEAFRSAIYRMTRSSNLEYGMEIPLFMNTAWGSVLAQYKQFTFASYQRFAVVAAQQMDIQSIVGITSMVGLGTLAGYVGLSLANKALPDTPEKWLELGIEKSGILSLLFDAENVISQATEGRIGFKMLDEKRKPTYGGGLAEGVLGPSLNSVTNIGKSAGGLVDLAFGKDPNASQISAFRRVIPYQNSIVLSGLFDLGEDKLRSKFGVKPRKVKK